MPTVTVVWNVARDGHKICPICLDMDGYTWVIPLGEGQKVDELIHPKYGIVSSRTEGSLVYHSFGHCHCTIDVVDIDFTDMIQPLRELRDRVQSSSENQTEMEVTE